MSATSQLWGGEPLRPYKRAMGTRDEDSDWAREFEHNAYNRAVMARIEETDAPDLQYCIACNRRVLRRSRAVTIKVTIHGPYGVGDNEFLALAEPFQPPSRRPQEIGAALVGTKVPAKVLFEYSKHGKIKQATGFVLSLQDADDDGHLVYYLRRARLVAERMLPHDFVLARMEEVDWQVVASIREFLQHEVRRSDEPARPKGVPASVPDKSPAVVEEVYAGATTAVASEVEECAEAEAEVVRSEGRQDDDPLSASCATLSSDLPSEGTACGEAMDA